jgi:hypothetical protein
MDSNFWTARWMLGLALAYVQTKAHGDAHDLSLTLHASLSRRLEATVSAWERTHLRAETRGIRARSG